jgi:hypothetical protein
VNTQQQSEPSGLQCIAAFLSILPKLPSLRNPQKIYNYKMSPNSLFSHIPIQGGLEWLTIALMTLKTLRRAGGTFRD